jgi:hypothetical protein
MAKIRRLKKDVKTLASDLIYECETYMKFHPDVDRKKAGKIIADVEDKLQKMVYEINHFEKQGNVKPKDHYQKIINKAKKELIPLLDKIGDFEKK